MICLIPFIIFRLISCSLSFDSPPIIGFDCNQTEPEILSISTLEVGSCPQLSTLMPKTISKFGQIIQKHSLDHVRISTCQLTKSTFYFRCGANWYNYQVYPPSVGALINISARKCSQIHSTGFYKWSEHKDAWSDLAPNNTYQFSANEIGWTDSKGYCEGGSIMLNGQSFNDVVVQSSFTLSIRESYGTVDHETGTLNIEGTLSCKYSQGSCIDAKTGVHTWIPTTQSCPLEQYRLLYQGQINITSSDQDNKVLLSVNNPPFLFTSELGMKTYVCGLNMHLTEFPNILYLEQMQGNYQITLPPPQGLDIQLISYLNAKITFTYHNLLDSAQKMYLTAVHETCMVEREMLRNRIEIIRLNSAAGGLSSLLMEGLFAKTNGEVIHLIKCEPSQVMFRNSPICYDALPILYRNLSMYLLPNTHIISPYASEIPCSSITPLTYKIGGQWWSYTGNFQQAPPPQVLQPKSGSLPAFTRIRSFSQGGMYSHEDVEAIQKLLIFPALRESISTKFVDGVTRFSGKPVSFDITSVMSEADWKTVAKRQVEQVWGYFASIGNAVSGFIGIYFVYKLIKSTINCFIDGHELYQAFGCSLYLFGSIWGRLAQFFLRKSRSGSTSTPVPETTSDDIEMERCQTVAQDPLQGYVSPFVRLYPTAPTSDCRDEHPV